MQACVMSGKKVEDMSDGELIDALRDEVRTWGN